MKVDRLIAEHYRNITRAELEFSPGINLLRGDNAEGKTNALEAIYSFARGKSFRGATDAELVQIGEDGFYTEIGFSDFEREQTLSYRYYKGQRQRKKNSSPVEKVAETIGLFRAVLFHPGHLMLIKGGPSERRAFLDIAISQCRPTYMRHLSTYKTVLDQRNTLLRAAKEYGKCDYDQLEIWSESLAAAASEINRMRRDYIARLSPYAENFLLDLSGGRERMILSYESDVDTADRDEAIEGYRTLFRENVLREIQAGVTLAGVHRDDLAVTVNDLDARRYSSQGQQRSAVLAIKLAEGEVSRDFTGEYPVFLFDDVLSELDEGRRQYVVGEENPFQVIITSCEADAVNLAGANVIDVKGGTYVSSYR